MAEMLAIIEPREIMIEMPDLFKNCWVTGTNFPKNFVISGLSHYIRQLKRGLDDSNKLFQKLPVKYGFHTELIDTIEEDFKQLVHSIEMGPITIPIISALKHETVEKINADFFWEVIRYPVDFEKTIKTMLVNGDYIFIDAGPSGILATFVNYNLTVDSASRTLQMINQFGKDLSSMERLRTSISNFI
jgi:acyl transferase domain-containing protein